MSLGTLDIVIAWCDVAKCSNIYGTENMWVCMMCVWDDLHQQHNHIYSNNQIYGDSIK